MGEIICKVAMVTGHLELKPLRYTITERVKGWLRSSEFFIESEFATLGPFKTEREAADALVLCRQ